MAISIPLTASVSKATLASLAARYGKLPGDYLAFLERHDGAAPPDNVLKDTNDNVGVEYFIPAKDIIAESEEIDGFNKNLIPFAEDGLGNYICIGFNDHKIYFWDHEDDNEEGEVVSGSFKEFIDNLIPFELSQEDIEGLKWGDVWTRPGFKPTFR